MFRWMSEDLAVMLAPLASYRRLIEPPPAPGVRSLLRGPARVALVVGTFVTLTSVGQALPTLLLGSVFSWSWVPALQALAAAPLIAVARGRRVPFSSAMDLFFRGHLPWSLWLMGLAVLMMARFPHGLVASPDLGKLLLTALVPIAWTWVITFAYCRVVLALRWWWAAAGTLLYQGVIWSSAYLYVGAATFRLWPFLRWAGWLG
jgi:hypothetical protein